MGLLFWKNNKKIDAYAKTLAENLFSYVQPEVAQQYLAPGNKLPKKRQAQVKKYLAELYTQIKSFSETNSLGIYGKARLQMQLNERLEELGYDETVVKKISDQILLNPL